MLNAAGPASPSTPSRWYVEAAHTAVNVPFLDTVLYLLGITRERSRPPTSRSGRAPEDEPGAGGSAGLTAPHRIRAVRATA
ncbi:hypothetical protein SHIRM173S_12930 [Streptomyces hirsutus]